MRLISISIELVDWMPSTGLKNVRIFSVHLGFNWRQMKTTQTARIEMRLSQEQKEHFEYMAQLGGFKTLTDFMLFSAQKEAKRIQKEKGTILATVGDWEIFVDTMLNPPKPNAALRRAFKRYRKAIASR